MDSKIFLMVMVCTIMNIRSVSSQFPFAYPASSHPTQASTVKHIYPPAPLHYVNIGHKLAGDYKFGYDTGKGPLGQSFREEIRMADGTIQGTYGLVDELGHKRVVHYTAGKAGFIAQEDPDSGSIDQAIPSTPPPQSRYVEHPNMNYSPPQVTVPLSSFKLANYHQTKTTAPRQKTAPMKQHLREIYRVKTPDQNEYSQAPKQQIEEREALLKSYRSPKELRSAKANNYSPQFTAPQSPFKQASYHQVKNTDPLYKKPVSVQQFSLEKTQVQTPEQAEYEAPASAQQVEEREALLESYRSPKELRPAKAVNYSPRQVTASMSPFKVANYHQMKTSAPLQKPMPMKQQSLEIYQVQPPQKVGYESPAPALQMGEREVLLESYRSPKQLRTAKADNYNHRRVSMPQSPFKTASYHQKKTSAIVQKPEPMRQHSMEIYQVQNPEQVEYEDPVPMQHIEERETFLKSYRSPKELRRVKTVGQVQSHQMVQKKEMIDKAEAYDPKIEDEYYDSIPAFIDIERLSYNIGTNKNGRERSKY